MQNGYHLRKQDGGMGRIIRIGSRKSALAVAQAKIVGEQIRTLLPEAEIEYVTMSTKGDRILDRSLDKIGGKGLFVKELEAALLDGRIDLAVHSLKDMPMKLDGRIPILAYGKREDPRDVLVFRPGRMELPQEGIVGTSSRRRSLQISSLYPKCRVKGIRGNVQTRLEKLEQDGFDATLLAAAGLKRLGMEALVGRYLSVEEMIPAAGQGILGIQGRREEEGVFRPLLDCPDSRSAALAERQFIRSAGGDCTSPSAAHAYMEGGLLKIIGFYYDEPSGRCTKGSISVKPENAEKGGEMLALSLMKEER